MRVLLATLSIGAVGAGAVLISSATPTGAVIGGSTATSILGICLVLAGVFGLADVQHGTALTPDVRSYRRWLARRGESVTDEEALNRYNALAIEAARHRTEQPVTHPLADIDNMAATYLKDRRIPEKREELIRLAHACGYETWDGAREGTQILAYNGKILNVIPNHRTINKTVSRKILETMASGTSNYRTRDRDQKRASGE